MVVSLLEYFVPSTGVILYFKPSWKHLNTGPLQASTLLYSLSFITWNLPQKLFLTSRSSGSSRSSLPEDWWVIKHSLQLLRSIPVAIQWVVQKKIVVKIQESYFHHPSLGTWKNSGLNVQGRDMWRESEELKPNHHTCRKLHIWQDELGRWENKQPTPKRRNKIGLTDTQHLHLGCLGRVSDSLTWVFFMWVWVSEWKLA